MLEKAPIQEDYLAAVALGKTIAFLLYSILVPVLLGALVLLPSFERLPDKMQALVSFSIFAAAELLLLFLVVKGYLPGTRAEMAQPFSEKQIGLGLTIVSVLVALFRGTTQEGIIIQWIVNGALVVSVAVYFATKSVLSRRPRWGVLSVLFLPALQLYYHWKLSGS